MASIRLTVLNVPADISADQLTGRIFDYLKIPCGKDDTSVSRFVKEENPINANGLLVRSVRMLLDGGRVRDVLNNGHHGTNIENFSVEISGFEMPVIVNGQVFSSASVRISAALFNLLESHIDNNNSSSSKVSKNDYAFIRNLQFTKPALGQPHWTITGHAKDLVELESTFTEILGLNKSYDDFAIPSRTSNVSNSSLNGIIAQFGNSLKIQSTFNQPVPDFRNSNSTKPKFSKTTADVSQKNLNVDINSSGLGKPTMFGTNLNVEFLTGDLTKLNVDAIVNTVVERAGKAHCKARIVGQTEYFPAKGVKAKYVIDVYVPRDHRHFNSFNQNKYEEYLTPLLQKCYENCIECARNLQLTSIAFPAPIIECLGMAFAAEIPQGILNEMAKKDKLGTIRRIIFVSTSKVFTEECEKKFLMKKGNCQCSAEFFKSVPNGTSNASGSAGSSSKAMPVDDDSLELDECSICYEINGKDLKVLPKCKHKFHKACIDKWWQHRQSCPLCGCLYGLQRGNQPPGRCTIQFLPGSVPGFKANGIIQITYDIPSGIQTEKHPNPSKPFIGTRRVAYLPNTADGQMIARLLETAFDYGLIFTVGTSVTTGQTDTVVWNNIHHKTSLTGGPTSYGYPDPTYLDRVQDELKAAGIDSSMLQ